MPLIYYENRLKRCCSIKFILIYPDSKRSFKKFYFLESKLLKSFSFGIKETL